MRRHWRSYPVDKDTCKLYLPFYKYGSEQNKIWDISGNDNHGEIVGAVPGAYPMLSGREFVTNGRMESGNPPTGWYVPFGVDVFERSGVQEHTGYYSMHLNDPGGSTDYTYQTGATQKYAGRHYKYSFWFYIVSGTMVSVYWNGNLTELLQDTVTHTTTGSWQYYEAILLETVDGVGRNGQFATPDNGEFYIDDVSVQEVVGYEGIGWEFDGVTNHVVVADSDSLDMGGSDFTIMLWARTKGQLGCRYISKRNAGNGLAVGYEVIHWGTLPHTVGLFLGDVPHGTTTSGLSMNQTIFPDRWQHIAVTFDRDGYATGYIDGVAGGMPRDISGFAGTVSNSTDLYIGRFASAVQQLLSGSIGEVLIFNLLLSAQEIRNHRELTRSIFGV